MKCVLLPSLLVVALTTTATTCAGAIPTKHQDAAIAQEKLGRHWHHYHHHSHSHRSSKCPTVHRAVSKGDESRLSCTVGSPGNFSMYELATVTTGGSNINNQKENGVWGSSRTLHGLWPNYAAGNDGYPWPQYCSSEAFNVNSLSSVQGLRTAMDQYWPSISHNLQQGTTTTAKSTSTATTTTTGGSGDGNEKFWAHEWGRHGTCSGFTQAQFFTTAINFFLQVRGSMSSNRMPFSKSAVNSVPSDKVVNDP